MPERRSVFGFGVHGIPDGRTWEGAKRAAGSAGGQRRRAEVENVEVTMPAQGRADPEPPSGANADGKEAAPGAILFVSHFNDWRTAVVVYNSRAA